MTIAKNAASKLFVAMVAAAMVFTLATPAKAATAEELQAQIDALMAQISSLQGGGSASASTAACTFTRPLTIGSQGEDVKCLQDAMTPTYFNHAGGSTGYFGAVTQAAVAKWQAANGVTPAVGYFGPISQAKFASMAPTTPTGDDDDDDTTATDDDDDDSTDDGELTGEASLDTFEVSDGEDADDVEEGSEDVKVGEFQVEFVDGDARITRLDLALAVDAGNNGDDDAFDVFQDVSLWVDGEEVGRIDASDEDEYLDEDNGSLRFASLDIVAREDEEVTIEVAVTVNDSVDGVTTGDDEDWNIAAGSLRYVDADDVTTTESATGDQQAMDGSYAGTLAEFSIDEAGAGDDLDLETSSEDPDAKTIALDEDNNVEEDIFAFELSAEDSDGDVDLNEVIVSVQTLLSGGDVTTDDLVNDFRLEIDGESFSAESYSGTGTTTEITFDIDGDFTIKADEVATAVLFADFENMDTTALEGATIQATTTASFIDAEGVEDITVDGSAVSGETHSLRTEGLDVTYASDDTTKTFTADESGEKDKVKYEVTFKVMAVGDAMYLDRTVTRDDTTAGGSAGDGFMWATTTDSTTGTTTVSAVVSAEDTDSDDTATKFYIAEGEEREFTIAVTLESGTDGVAAVKLTAINWTTDSTDGTPDNFHTTGLDDFKTDLEDLFSE